MWPMLLDMSKGECKRMLRRLELEAYCSIVSALRAQGELNKSKKKVLNDLQNILSISTERHRAEIRRAVNDEKLETIADNISGPNSASDWLIEGRRLIPLMPRLVPQTAFTATANQFANAQAEKNATMPSPSQTGNKDLMSLSSPTTPINGGQKTARPQSPNSNVVVLPSGMSIHIKGGLNTEEEEEPPRKRRRSQSTENIVSPSASTQTPRVTYTTSSNMSPMKITISKSPQSGVTQSQKVILVTSAGQTTSPSILQKSITVPVVRTSSSNLNMGQSRILQNTSSMASNGNLGNIVNMTQSSHSTSTASVGTSTMTFLTPTVSIPRPRTKTSLPRQRFPQIIHGQQKPGVVIPMGPQPVQPTPQSVQNIQIKQLEQSGAQQRGQNIQIKTVPKSPSTIQIRQEGGMKIITQSVPGAGGSKILPRPSQLTTASGTPVVVVSGGSNVTTATNVTMVSRPITSIGQPGTKILNISTQGGKIVSTGTSRAPNIVTVNPKTLHLTAVKSGGHPGGKPNVIVVQKTQPKRSGTPTGQPKTTTIVSSPFEKELMNFLQKQDSTKQLIVNTPGGPGQRPIERKVIVTTPGQLEASRQKAKLDAESRTSSLLAELIQAAGIVPDGGGAEGSGDVTINLDEATMSAFGVQATESQSKGTSQSLPNNEWFEYDVADDNSQTFQTSDSGSQLPKVTVQRTTSVDLSQLSDQLSSQQFYTIEQAMKILNQPDKTESVVTSDVPSVADLASEIVTSGTELTTEVVSMASDVTSEVSSVPTPNQDSESSQDDSHFSETQASAEIGLDSIRSSNITTSTQSALHLPQTTQSRGLGLGGGELDPQTGIFYTVTTTGQDGSTETHVTMEAPHGSNSKTFDLLSSSLAQAQIDLDPYQFVEEDVLTAKMVDSESSSQGEITGEITGAEIQEEEVASMPEGEEIEVQSSLPAIRVKPSKFIPLQDVSKTSTINVTREVETVVPDLTFSQDEVVLSHEDVGHLGDVEISMDPNTLQGDMSAVAIETSHSIDPVDVRSEMVALEDFGESASAGASSSSESQGDAGYDNSLVRLSKRKRKPPSSIEDSPTQSVGGWIRACLGLIQRVSRYRGLNREKGDLNAASWFTQPVEPADAPDYYTIVKNPMDFGTIRRKIENGLYSEHEEFHSDMLLVRDNCRLYNPPGSIVRRDCDEVFAFYMSEYEKILERWQKVHVSSPSAKKLKFDKSPVRS